MTKPKFYQKPKLNRYEMAKQKTAEKQRDFMKTVMWINLYGGGIGILMMVAWVAATAFGAPPK